ncbi:MAG: extracellular solute-binding protein [Anaerolineaceae bacterium]|nr:extracellular solute-binding protein [Anaerolineaceae bacterium]
MRSQRLFAMLRARWARVVILMVLLALLTAPMAALRAQDSVTITLGLPQFVETIITPELIAQFEEQNPGIKVQTVPTGFPDFPPATADVAKHFEAVEKYMSAADVNFMGSSNLSPEAAEAGYFLDLSPLTAADTDLNPDDFFPDVWQSVQWDGKVWMIPVSTDVVSLAYNKEAFDKAGIAYPSGAWTVDDLDRAARALVEKDPNGKVTKPALVMFGDYTGLLVRSLLGASLYDSSVTPNAPLFSNPDLEPILTTLAKLEQDGVVSPTFSGQVADVPMRITGSFGLSGLLTGEANPPGASLLPGGKAGINAQGFVISSGTLYPEQAYKLLKFLSLAPAVANNFLSASPARQSMVGVQPPPPSDDTGAAIAAIRPTSPEAQAMIAEALQNGLPASEDRYSAYITQALAKMVSDNLDARTALQNAEVLAVTNQKAAADKHTNLIVSVATPIPQTVLGQGEVSLKFGMLSMVSPMPNRDLWDQVIKDFVDSDPQIGEIKLDTGINQPEQSAKKFDCFYLPLNYVPQIDPTTILNLDPFMDADASFDRGDIINGVLPQVQRDNKTWAMPIVIQPDGMKYDAEAFQKAGVPLPENGWTINEFADALKTLKAANPDKSPFQAQGVGGTYLLLLTAAYGGLPIDYRTNPPTFNFTDANSITALQQVLDLAKEGYIKYGELAGNGLASFISAGADRAPIYTESLSGFAFGAAVNAGADPYKLTTYPTGSTYNGATYSIGTAYVSAISQNPDGCYRWLSTLSRHPELFTGMPARLSLLDDPSVLAMQKPDETVFYKNFVILLQDPNTISFPSLLSSASPSTFLIQRWIDKAFDNYVLHDGDLVGDLATAESYVKGFTECINALSPEDQRNQLKYIDCAGKVDPNMKSLFGAITGSSGS